MASAFQAGMIGGFADTFAQKIQERTDKTEKYENMMIDAAKANAPKYAETTAAYKATVNNAKELKSSFNFTDAEILAMASKHDLTAIHKTLMEQKLAAEASGNSLMIDKSTILGSLNMMENITMPKGMTLDSGLQQILFNTTQNINNSANPKSEVDQRSAFAKGVASFLSLNPRATAEEQLKGMQYAGVDVNTLYNFNAAAGKGDIFPEYTAGSMSFPDQDYKPSDFKDTEQSAMRYFANRLKVANADGTGVSLDATEAIELEFNDGKTTEQSIDLVRDIDAASNKIAQLESSLAYTGWGKGFGNEGKRISAISNLKSHLYNSPEDLKKFVEAEQKGLFTQMILGTDGNFTAAHVDAVLNGQDWTTVTEDAIESEASPSVAEAGTNDALEKAQPGSNNQTAPPVSNNQTAQAAAAPSLTNDPSTAAQVARLTGNREPLGLSDIELRNRREAADEDGPLLASNVTDALVSGQAFGKSVSDVTGVVADKVAAMPFQAVAAISDAVAFAADFVAGAMGAEESSPGSKRLRVSADRQRQTASEIAAKGWLSSMGISSPESVEAVAEGFRNTVFTEDGVKTANGLMSYEDFAKASSKTRENVEPRFIREGDRIRLNPDFVEPVSEGVTPTQSELEVFKPAFPGDVPDDLEEATTESVSESLRFLTELPDRIHQSLFDTQDKINASIASLFEETLEERIMKNEGQQNRVAAFQALKDKIAAMRKEAEAEPLVAKPKRTKKPLKPKGMTDSDKARLKRAQKADEIRGGDSGLLQMLVNKYGSVIVQKEMGL